MGCSDFSGAHLFSPKYKLGFYIVVYPCKQKHTSLGSAVISSAVIMFYEQVKLPNT